MVHRFHDRGGSDGWNSVFNYLEMVESWFMAARVLAQTWLKVVESRLNHF